MEKFTDQPQTELLLNKFNFKLLTYYEQDK